MTDTFALILVRRVDDVQFVTLNQPATRNALSPAMVAELTRAVSLAGADASLRALVLRGTASFFCAGGNVGNFEERLQQVPPGSACLADDPVAASDREFGGFMQRLAALPMPVLAAVEGAAMGGGMGLACAADLVLATREARFALSETSLGIIPAQIAPFVVERIGRRVALRMGLTGERVSGDRAVHLGLVDELAADGAVLDALLAQWLTRILACAPQANRALKTLLRRCGRDRVEAVLDDAALAFARCLRDEGAEGIAAFRARRPAAWQRVFGADAVRAAHEAPPPAAGNGS